MILPNKGHTVEAFLPGALWPPPQRAASWQIIKTGRTLKQAKLIAKEWKGNGATVRVKNPQGEIVK